VGDLIIYIMRGYTSIVTSVAISPSPDGLLLASGSWDKIVRLRDMATGNERCVAAHPQYRCRSGFFLPVL